MCCYVHDVRIVSCLSNGVTAISSGRLGWMWTNQASSPNSVSCSANTWRKQRASSLLHVPLCVSPVLLRENRDPRSRPTPHGAGSRAGSRLYGYCSGQARGNGARLEVGRDVHDPKENRVNPDQP